MTSSPKITVIVVDDDASVCRALKTLLRILGFEVAIFPNAEVMLAGRFPSVDSCVLSDVYLPGMSGIELCRHLAKAGTPLPVILMTGRDDQYTKRLMREAKPVACLFKPFEEAALIRAIGKAMRPISAPQP